jgi:DNA-binding CsgD family transcriptional regulator
MPSETELLDLLYRAPTDAESRSQFLSAVARRFEAPCSALINADTVSEATEQTTHGIEFEEQSGMPPESLPLYRTRFAEKDPWFLACRERRLTEWVGAGSSLCPAATFEKTEFYNEFFRPHRFPGFHQLGALISPRPGQQAVLTLHRERWREDFDGDDLRDFHSLVPHLRRALLIGAEIVNLRAIAETAGSVLASLDVGIMALDKAGHVCFLNTQAESILRCGNFLRLRNGRLEAAVASESAVLERILRTTATGVRSGQPAGGNLTLHHANLSMHISVLPLVMPIPRMPEHARVLLTLSQDATPKRRDRALAALFNLTPVEIRVTMLLVQGLEPREIASRTSASYETVRFQLKSIYKKMNVSRQSQVVRIVSLIPGDAAT